MGFHYSKYVYHGSAVSMRLKLSSDSSDEVREASNETSQSFLSDMTLTSEPHLMKVRLAEHTDCVS